MLRVVDEDGSPEAVLRLRDAVAAAIDGTGRQQTPDDLLKIANVSYPALSGGLPVAATNRDVRDALAAGWVQAHGNDSAHTAERYARDITIFFGWADGHGYDVLAMLPWHVDQHRQWLQTAEHASRYRCTRRLSPSTIAGRLNILSSFYRYVQRNVTGSFVPNPAEHAGRPRVSRKSKTHGLTGVELDARACPPRSVPHPSAHVSCACRSCP